MLSSKASGLGLGFRGLGFRVGFGVSGLGFRGYDLGFRVGCSSTV